MPCFYCGYFLTLRPFVGQNPDEKQAIVKIDVSKGQGRHGFYFRHVKPILLDRKTAGRRQESPDTGMFISGPVLQ
ncbi:hypothetical protein OWK27_19805 [Enterobacter cloacae complex sp. 2022EL-00788]|uniref:hypothetical protein n=1 Tax=Enterobacter cloacae complex sp. 2022EL-00788 TaxID=2996512 RepID=UPI002270DE09|nr:hypothetical protein [Enterobacter cloacae complex sp. 2022EL-00788]MCY0774937.1 hypothetical protein [Enterobacter cloacae complex sp. 2022EL-00788]